MSGGSCVCGKIHPNYDSSKVYARNVVTNDVRKYEYANMIKLISPCVQFINTKIRMNISSSLYSVQLSRRSTITRSSQKSHCLTECYKYILSNSAIITFNRIESHIELLHIKATLVFKCYDTFADFDKIQYIDIGFDKILRFGNDARDENEIMFLSCTRSYALAIPMGTSLTLADDQGCINAPQQSVVVIFPDSYFVITCRNKKYEFSFLSNAKRNT